MCKCELVKAFGFERYRLTDRQTDIQTDTTNYIAYQAASRVISNHQDYMVNRKTGRFVKSF